MAFSIYKKFNNLDVKDKFMLNVIKRFNDNILLKEISYSNYASDSLPIKEAVSNANFDVFFARRGPRFPRAEPFASGPVLRIAAGAAAVQAADYGGRI